MNPPEAAGGLIVPPESFPAGPAGAALLPMHSSMAAALLWAGTASTLHRVRAGEGALIAINLSLIAYHGLTASAALAHALISLLAIVLMYAFNDLYDAPHDAKNPKKDRALVATYLEYRRSSGVAILSLTAATVALALVMIGSAAALAVAAVMLVNVVYSTVLKGAPVIDVAWCGVWGACYAAIVGASPATLLLVGVMTAVCHLYQALDDRDPDAANGIVTTAVRSRGLSTGVLVVLAVLLGVVLHAPLGAWAMTAVTPLALYFACGTPRTGWLLTKAYFGVVWIAVLEVARAAV